MKHNTTTIRTKKDKPSQFWIKVKERSGKIWLYFKNKKNWLYSATVFTLLILLGLEIYWLRDDIVSVFQNQSNWASVVTVFEIILLAVLWTKFPKFKKVFGEGKSKKRSRVHSGFIFFLAIIFLLPFTFLYVDGLQIQPDKVSLTTQLSVIAISSAFAAITLTASRISNITPNKRLELICVSQKFIMVTVLFIFFAAALNMIDTALNGINVNSFSTSNLVSPIDWYRGVLFYLSVPSFYGSIILFLVGLVDLVFAFFDLDTRPTIPRE